MPLLFVFFARPIPRRAGHVQPSWRQQGRMLRRFPRAALLSQLGRLTTWISRSEIVHCSVGYDGAVLEVTAKRNAFVPLLAYLANHPSLCCVVEIPIGSPPDLQQHCRPRPNHILPSFIKWWTRGLIRSRDCLCIVRRILIDAGVAVPRRIYTPVQLHDWLLEQGYTHATFDH